MLFNLASQYHANRLYNEALNTYLLIVKNKMFGSGGRLRLNMGNIYYEQKNYSLAVKNYRMALDQIPESHRRIRYYYYCCCCYCCYCCCFIDWKFFKIFRLYLSKWVNITMLLIHMNIFIMNSRTRLTLKQVRYEPVYSDHPPICHWNLSIVTHHL